MIAQADRDAADFERATLRQQADRAHTDVIIAEAKRYQAELAGIDAAHLLRLSGIDITDAPADSGLTALLAAQDAEQS